MKVLVVGSGAREHALVWKLARSPRISRLYAAPGNAGTAGLATNLDIKVTDFPALEKAVAANHIELIVVGPDDPLALGIVDHFQNIGIPIFGPTRKAAQLEASKVFAKSLFQEHGIPCARSQSFADIARAEQYIRQQNSPLVIKADGLALGKGVIIAETTEQALAAVNRMMKEKAFGPAGDSVIIEEKLPGKEMSFFAVTDSKTVLPLAPACDYKRINDGDQGLNTGGMGSYSPPFFYTPELGETIMSQFMYPTVQAMTKTGRPYQGVLYAGLIGFLLDHNQPKLLEFNARFGDPECQVILPRLKSDLMDIILGVVNGTLSSVKPEWKEEACVGVVMASGGYPVSYRTGLPVTGLDDLEEDIIVFHAGTKIDTATGQVLTSGGRVLTVVALGKTVNEAREKIYASLPRLKFDGCHYRKDIAGF